MTFLFIFTFAMTACAGVKLIGLIFGNSMTLPPIINMRFLDGYTPDSWIIIYPSVMYQAYFWFERAGVIV